VPVIDVIRGAIAEIEDYRRVAVATTAEDAVAGLAAADMIHLLAELIENATLSSPSGTRVEVRAERVANGFAVEIEDRGLGIEPGQLNTINEQLASPPDFDLANADQLGLFVVGRLAARHGARVSLRPSPYGGITAVVLMPNSVVVPGTERKTEPQPDQPLAITGPDPGLAPGDTLALLGPPPSPHPLTAAGRDNGTYRGLPRRIRQASLSPHLRTSPADQAAGTAGRAPPGGDRTPEQARDLVSSLQSGWQRGRQSDEPDPEPGAQVKPARQPDQQVPDDEEA
jgi:anti-sigma regulatory factor (Ser/Thr protein kinase)